MLMNLKQISTCSEKEVFTEMYFAKFAPFVFEFTSYSLWKAICVTVFFTQFIVASNLADVIVMVASVYLTTYFRKFSENFSTVMGKSQAQWEIIRKQHSQLLRLTRLTDDHFNGLVLLSFGKNLAFVCMQLNVCSLVQDGLVPLLLLISDGTVRFRHLPDRSAQHSRAKAQRIKLTIYEMPDVTYYKEARRLVAQINASTIALSGSHFFYVTRGSILTMAATLVTYELVMLQFTS
ncbi:Gustatory receptor for sugar taste 64b [Eumeta japonica]|uniref:Gustatory receptor for sugar taste 64b n=1 Tax=Eumeta variegata TaxID=151549 RepID=A0A4C1UJM3_EUMVA|nr:Gustatory receptor for sugar taste 64b [Eumeta japonica]